MCTIELSDTGRPSTNYVLRTFRRIHQLQSSFCGVAGHNRRARIQAQIDELDRDLLPFLRAHLWAAGTPTLWNVRTYSYSAADGVTVLLESERGASRSVTGDDFAAHYRPTPEPEPAPSPAELAADLLAPSPAGTVPMDPEPDHDSEPVTLERVARAVTVHASHFPEFTAGDLSSGMTLDIFALAGIEVSPSQYVQLTRPARGADFPEHTRPVDICSAVSRAFHLYNVRTVAELAAVLDPDSGVVEVADPETAAALAPTLAELARGESLDAQSPAGPVAGYDYTSPPPVASEWIQPEDPGTVWAVVNPANVYGEVVIEINGRPFGRRRFVEGSRFYQHYRRAHLTDFTPAEHVAELAAVTEHARKIHALSTNFPAAILDAPGPVRAAAQAVTAAAYALAELTASTQ